MLFKVIKPLRMVKTVKVTNAVATSVKVYLVPMIKLAMSVPKDTPVTKLKKVICEMYPSMVFKKVLKIEGKIILLMHSRRVVSTIKDLLDRSFIYLQLHPYEPECFSFMVSQHVCGEVRAVTG